ncbi:response regulator [Patescibacteria group bacterium]|nr:response regulator [Patescibacteria group bacterium]
MAKKRIMVVEDEQMLAKIIGMKLEEEEFEVIHAYDGEEAFELLSKPELPDLVLLDVLLPKMSGFDVLEKLKAEKSRFPRLLSSPTSRNDPMSSGRTAWALSTTSSKRRFRRRRSSARLRQCSSLTSQAAIRLPVTRTPDLLPWKMLCQCRKCFGRESRTITHKS